MTVLLFLAGVGACALFGVFTSMVVKARQTQKSWMGAAIVALVIAAGVLYAGTALETAHIGGISHPVALFRNGCVSGAVLCLAVFGMRKTLRK